MPTVRTNDVETYYVRRGDGPPIVFVHGAIVDHAQWTPQMASLDDAYTTVAYDVRGHGRTGGSARGAYSIDLFADDLHALVTELGLDRPVVCGLSMGGCIAQVHAARRPDAVAGLVLADTFTTELSRWDERLQMAALRSTILPARLVGYERVEKVLTRLNELASRGATGDYEEIEQLRARGPRMTTDEFAKVIRAVASFPRTAVDLSAVTAPTLVLYGERDLAFLRRQASTLGTRIPNATVREVPGAGHASNLDAPDFFTGAVRAFLETHVPPDAPDRLDEPGDAAGSETE